MHPGAQGPPGFPQHQHMQGPPQRGPPPGSMGGEHHTNSTDVYLFFSLPQEITISMRYIEGKRNCT